MAKAALCWSNTDLSDKTGLHKNTIYKATNDDARPVTLAFLQQIFEKEGIIFIEDNGVQFKSSKEKPENSEE